VISWVSVRVRLALWQRNNGRNEDGSGLDLRAAAWAWCFLLWRTLRHWLEASSGGLWGEGRRSAACDVTARLR